MTTFKFRTSIIILSLVAVVAIGLHWLVNRTDMRGASVDYAQEQFNGHARVMASSVEALADSVERGTDAFGVLADAAPGGYSYYVFCGDTLVAWKNAMLPCDNPRQMLRHDRLLTADNGVYYALSAVRGDFSVWSVFRVRSSYSVDNDYLYDEFDESLGLDVHAQLVVDETQGLPVRSPYGSYLFSVLCGSESQQPVLWVWTDAMSLLVWIVSLLWAVCLASRWVASAGRRNLSLLVLAVLLAGVYAWALSIRFCSAMGGWQILSAQVFAYDWWMPSLAYMVLAAVCVSVWCHSFCRCLSIDGLDVLNLKSRCPEALLLLLVAAAYAVYGLVNGLIDIMAVNSADLVVFVAELDLSVATMFKMLVLTLLMMSFIFVLDRIYSEMAGIVPVWRYVAVVAAFAVVVMLPVALLSDDADAAFYAGFVVFNALYYAVKRRRIMSDSSLASDDVVGLRYSPYVWLMLLMAVFLMMRFMHLNMDRERQVRDVLSNNLSYQLIREDDPIAESLLLSMEHSIATDSVVQRLFDVSDAGEDAVNDLRNYMLARYFDGYLKKYDVQIVPCFGEQSYINVNLGGEQFDCNEYFGSMVDIFGRQIADSCRFYGLDDNDGLASYFGQFAFYSSHFDDWSHLNIELNQRPQMVGTGYPELLTNNRDRIDPRPLRGYSYAKYHDGRLMTQYGSFRYSRHDEWFHADTDTVGTKRYLVSNGCSHYIYRVTPSQDIVLSFPLMTVAQFLADYSFLFVVMFIMSSLMMLLVMRHYGSSFSGMSVLERIQSAFVTLVMALLIVVCMLSAWESMNSFDAQDKQNIRRTLRIVKNTFEQQMDAAPDAPLTRYDVDRMLKVATISVAADAHFYTTDGRLVGTSKRELFDHGIAAPLIDSEALLRLRHGDDIFTDESIGHMDYYVAYTPVTDMYDNLVGYLALPYFYDVNARRTRLKSTIVPITNAYMIVMLLAIMLSYPLARGITKPLHALAVKLSNVDITHKNDKLDYASTDEIGLLVTEYNRMIDELERSAQQLALTEREMTWREMARQIAHEIKNPLTPMKLSVQYMIKAWERMDSQKFDEFIRRTAQTLVEQIDQMAAVASQFSNVAKMQQGEMTRVDIAEKLAGTVLLYSKSENATVALQSQVEHAFAIVNADQILSVFNNLIKNALQSVGSGQHADIRVSLDTDDTSIHIAVADNGRGIEPEVRDKIFKPNFTTKSTGMGLGLAIVKTIIVNAKGDIWFDTEVGQGTTFHVRLPLA